MATATTPPAGATTLGSAPSSASLPPLSELLSAPSLDPYVSQLDEATLAVLYNQPPPLGSPSHPASSTAVYSSPAAVDSLKAVDVSLGAAIDAAWKLSILIDAGPDGADTANLTAGAPRTPLSLHSAVSSLLSSLAALDAAARQCDVQVPQSLLEQLNEGRNPERGLADVLEQLIASNDRSRGRAIATQSLRECTEEHVALAAEKEREAQQQRKQTKLEGADAVK